MNPNWKLFWWVVGVMGVSMVLNTLSSVLGLMESGQFGLLIAYTAIISIAVLIRKDSSVAAFGAWTGFWGSVAINVFNYHNDLINKEVFNKEIVALFLVGFLISLGFGLWKVSGFARTNNIPLNMPSFLFGAEIVAVGAFNVLYQSHRLLAFLVAFAIVALMAAQIWATSPEGDQEQASEE